MGIDVDYCRAISASLFQGEEANVVFSEAETNADGLQLLATGDIDIMSGSTWNLQNDIHESNTGLGFQLIYTAVFLWSYGGRLCCWVSSQR